MRNVKRIRIFLCSPGDVVDERKLAMQVIEAANSNPFLPEDTSLQIIAWDKPNADTPMLATMTPQEAINSGLAKPSECDVVVVILCSRMGTPLPFPQFQKIDGTPYRSGTEWEYEDAKQGAVRNGKPTVVVYRRMQVPSISLNDPKIKEKQQQYEQVQDFFAQFTERETGAALAGYNTYETPDDFRKKFEYHLPKLLKEFIQLSQRSNVAQHRDRIEVWANDSTSH